MDNQQEVDQNLGKRKKIKKKIKANPQGFILLIVEIILIIIFIAVASTHYFKKVPDCSDNQTINFDQGVCDDCPPDTWRSSIGKGDPTDTANCNCLNNNFEFKDGVCSCKAGYEEVITTQNISGKDVQVKNCLVPCKTGNNLNSGPTTNSLNCRCTPDKIYEPLLNVCSSVTKVHTFLVNQGNTNHTSASAEYIHNSNPVYHPIFVKHFPETSTVNLRDVYGITLTFGQKIFIKSTTCRYNNSANQLRVDTVPINKVFTPNEFIPIFNKALRIGVSPGQSSANVQYININCIYPYQENHNYQKSYFYCRYSDSFLATQNQYESIGAIFQIPTLSSSSFDDRRNLVLNLTWKY